MSTKSSSRTFHSYLKASAGFNLLACKAGFVNRDRKAIDESFKYIITDEGLRYLEEK